VLLSLVKKLSEVVYKSEITNLPEVQRVEVTNPPAEIKIPEFPDIKIPEVKFDSVIKAIKDKVIPLDDSATKKQILKELQAIKTALNEPEEEDRTDDIIEAINGLLGAVLSLREEDKELDLSPIVKAIKEIDTTVDWSPLEKLTTHNEVNVKINSKQFEKLVKSVAGSIAVSSGGGGGNLKIASGDVTPANPVPTVPEATINLQQSYSSKSEGEYDNLSLTGWRELRTKDQRQLDLANCNDYTEFTTLGNDTTNLADTLDHVFGTGAIIFDKINGADDTVYAGVQQTITSLNFSEIFESGAFVGLGCKLTSIADVVSVFIHIGTDSSNYNCWEWGVDNLTVDRWMALRAATSQPYCSVGNGWNQAAVTYVAFGVEFSDESDTLADIKFDNVHLVGGRVTDSTTNATVTASINTPNINVHRMGGTPVDTNAGNVSAATQRVVLASDQPVVSVEETTSLPINIYAEVGSIASETETTVVTYAVPAGKTLNIQGFLGTGTSTGRFRLFLDAVVEGILRTSTAERSTSVDYGRGVIQATTGTTVTIKAYHEETANQTFQGNLFGYLT